MSLNFLIYNTSVHVLECMGTIHDKVRKANLVGAREYGKYLHYARMLVKALCMTCPCKHIMCAYLRVATRIYACCSDTFEVLW